MGADLPVSGHCLWQPRYSSQALYAGMKAELVSTRGGMEGSFLLVDERRRAQGPGGLKTRRVCPWISGLSSGGTSGE